MSRIALVLLILATAACSKKNAENYGHCLKLRLGMTQSELFKIMGAPDETLPYIEGKSLPHLKGRTAYEWANPASMPGPNHVSVEDARGELASIRCSDSVITTSVFLEPPAPSTGSVHAGNSSPAKIAAPPTSDAPVGTGAPGRALTGNE